MANPTTTWQLTQVRSPHLPDPVPVIAALDIPYIASGNRLQNLSIYLHHSPANLALVGQPVSSLPAPPTSSTSSTPSPLPHRQVHIHGGAWRAPDLSSRSIEASVAHTFSGDNTSTSTSNPVPIDTVISVNYTLSPFPEHPTDPYPTATQEAHADAAREAVHPGHVRDVLAAFGLLRTFGLADGSYILTGHSCGACIAFQAALRAAKDWDGVDGKLQDIPTPAALLGMNGLFDLPGLVHELGSTHGHLADVYSTLLGHAFGDESGWAEASPARFDTKVIAGRLAEGRAPALVVVDQSVQDQLVPVSQADKMETNLRRVEGLVVVRGKRCKESHAAPWEQGYMIWESLKDILQLLGQKR